MARSGAALVAAEITTESPDFGHLEPVVRASRRELAALGLGDPGVVLADAGYWHQRQMQQIAGEGIPVLSRTCRAGPPRGGRRPRRGEQPPGDLPAPEARAGRAAAPTRPVDRIVLEVAHANPTDGTRMVAALAGRELGDAVNRKRVQR